MLGPGTVRHRRPELDETRRSQGALASGDEPARGSATVGLKVQENSRCENVSSSVSSSRFYQTILPLLFFQQRKALILGSTRSTCCRL